MTLQFVYLSVLIDAIIGAQLINCPPNSLKFEKVLGLRPSPSNHPLLLYQNSHPNVPVTTECLAKCSSDPQCRSFVIYYNVSSCYWFRNTIQGVQEYENVVDTETAWFVKICLDVRSCEKLWIFERIPGATLIGNDTKILPQPLTRTDCQQYCLEETDFVCRSVKFKIRENRQYGPNDETTGICILSSSDRHIQAGSYRVSGFDEEYFENQCSSVYNESKNEFCAYEEFENTTLSRGDLFYERKTKESCQQLCENTTIFNCRGFSLVPSTPTNFDCFLHSEDSKVHGPKLLKSNPLGRYFERAQCINISITCSETYMTVNYKPKTKFMGLLYMQGYSEEPQCFVKGSGNNALTLKLSLLSNGCGIIKANGPDNRTLMSGIMLLQYNPFIQTHADRVIRIGCIFGNDSKVILGTGVTISSAPNIGSTLINSSNTSFNPTVEMRVVDFNTQNEVSSTEIGQELELIIEIKPPNGPYDIWAGHLIAMTEKSDESILLLDDRGCPTNLNVFPALNKVVTNQTRSLEATFQAFKFSSSPIVRFSVIVQFCPETCPAVDCGGGVQSYGRRRKRDIQTREIDTISGTKIINVNRTQFERTNGHKRVQMPLEFIMLVRNPGAISDRLIIGDSKILVAGYDFVTNEVCIDYSLFVGLIVTLILIQIIFAICCALLVKRYKRLYEEESLRQSTEELHKNFGIGFSNLENRRVHWADNGDFT